MHTVRRLVAFVVLACLFATPAFAQTYTYSVYIDSDVNSATGCSVTLPNGTFAGVESVLTATVATGSPPQVTSVTRSMCSGSTFGAPVAEGSGAVSVGAGNGGTTAIELTDAVSQLVPPGTQTARIYVVARSATGDDVLLTTVGAAPIVVLLAQNVDVLATPLFGIPALILFIGCLLAFGSRAVRRRILKPLLLGLALFSGIAGAMIFPWNGLPPIATDPAGDTTSGEDAIDLRYFFVAVNDGYAFFRCDVVGNLSKPDHAPSFVKGADQTVLEDAAAQSVANWATAINDNDGNTQTLNFIVSNSNNTLFSVQPAISPTGTLTYTLAPNANGTALVTVQLHDNGGTANGGVDTSAAQTFNINVTAINDAPSFTKGADEGVLEDSGAHSVASWATAILAGPADEAAQTLNFIVSNNNKALFSVQPAIATNGTLTYTLAAGQKGAALVTVQLHDNGGTANGGVDTSVAQTFNINVSLVNHAPGFTKGADQTVLEDAAAQSLPNWATAINDNDGNTQTLNFIVSNTNNALFSVQPAISTTGTLTYTLAANANGTALVTVQLHDNGGTANGGVDTSVAQTFNVNVTAVNDAPSFTKGANENVLEGSGAHSVPGWATAISSGPPDESAQTITFLVTGNSNSALFSVAPSVATDGTLSYTLATGAFGTSTITLVAKDTGGTANGGADTSAPQTFTISAAQLAPTVSAVSPASGPTAGGTTVTITGTDLTGATAVKFGAGAATSFTVNSATSITATAPPASAGTIDVTVTTSAATSATNLADQYTYAGTPTVTGVAPTSGPTAGGTSVTITGTNLTGATAVTFGATPAASFTVNSATSISAVSPAGAGTVDVKVTTAGGTTATSAADQYTYVAAPTVASVAPTSGPHSVGTDETITGTNLTGATAVTFGATPATSFTVNSATSITATAPAGAAGVVDVKVTTAGGTTATSAADQYTYVAAPAVTSVAPSSGPTAGGTLVTITGTSLTGATAVTFGATPATSFTVNSATSITATAPAGAASVVDITVTTAGGTSATSAADQYTYVAAPTVTSVSPTSGPSAGGTAVTITGTNLTAAIAVTFGATPATSFTVNSATSISAVSPAGAGTVDVTVTTAGGTSATSAADQYTFFAPPGITSVSPAAGPTAGGTTVTINGSNLGGATTVTFGGASAAIVTDTPTQITVTAPPHAAGTVDVVVTTPGGTATATNAYTYAVVPAVTSVAPTSGPTAGGTVVTVTGTSLTGATAVKFGAAPATAFTVNSATSITATAPAGAAGVVDITVTTAGGTSATSAADQYTYVAAPTVTSVSPTGGPSAGGTAVAITGTNLNGAIAVTFGATPATSFTVNSATSISAVSPAGAGTVDVRVTTAGGTSATSAADQYTFFAPPGITSVSPAAGPTAGGTVVTINGSNLGGATTVTFGGASASIVTDTPTQITVTTPAHAAGLVDVVVTTPGGSATATNAYTYAVAPTAGNDTYATVGNTALVVGIAPPTTPYVSSSTLLLGNDSTLGSPSITITQAPAGTISSLNAATGAFVYTPPAGFTGTDTFKYTVTDASTLTSAPATVSIGVSSRVWYVNGAAGAGNGTSASPFNTLAVSPPFAAGDTVFVESGATPTSTSGVITLTAGVTLWGQGTSLPAISGIAIANTAATSKPIVTSTIVLGGNNTTISSLDINTSGTQGLVSSGGPYSGVSIANDVTVTSSGATAVTLTNVSGSLSFRKIAASGVGAGVGISLTNIGGAGFSVTGDGATAGSGGVISGTCTTGVTGCAAVVLANAGAVSLAWMNLTSSTGSGVWATDTSATVAKTSLSNYAVVGIRIAASSVASGAFNLHDNTLTGIGGDAIQLQLNGTATWTGHVKANLIGNSGVANSGSAGGNGIDVDVAGGGTATVDVSNNQINQIHANYGIRATATSGTLNASVQGNTIAMAQPTGIDGITVLSSATICLNATGNSAAAAGLAVQNGLFDGVGMSVLQNTSTSVFKIQGYSVSNDTGVQNYLVSSNTSFSGPGGATFADSASAGNPGFANAASCPIAP